MCESIVEHIIEWQKDRNLDQMPYDHYNETLNRLEEICESWGLTREYAEQLLNTLDDCSDKVIKKICKENTIDSLFDECIYAIGAMMKLGYDPIKVFEEGLKEINERTGAYDPTVGKWVKQPKKPNAYKANYENARL